MSWIPGFGFRFDGERGARGVRSSEFLQLADIDFSDPFKAALGRLLDILSEEVPVITQRYDRKPTDRGVFADEETGRKPLAIPLVGTDGPNDVLTGDDRHGYDESRSTSSPRASFASAPSSPVASR